MEKDDAIKQKIKAQKLILESVKAREAGEKDYSLDESIYLINKLFNNK